MCRSDAAHHLFVKRSKSGGLRAGGRRTDERWRSTIRKEQENFTALKAQAEILDRDELTEARLAMRKKSERQAWERIRQSLSSGKVSFQTFRMSVKDTDELLGESDADGKAVTREKNRYNWEERNASL